MASTLLKQAVQGGRVGGRGSGNVEFRAAGSGGYHYAGDSTVLARLLIVMIKAPVSETEGIP